MPDLPAATYDVWVRGYGLVDSPKQQVSPGTRLDLRAVVGHTGEATLLVAEGDATDPEALFRSALASPLAGLQVEGASGCLLQIEGGRRMTVAQVNSVADAFTRGFSDDSQVILGARMADELDGRMRVVAVVSGL